MKISRRSTPTLTPLALACLGSALLLPPMAFAQTSSNVTLYGAADAGFVHESGGKDGSINRISSGILGGSYWGMKGREDLGNGNAAIFTMESGVRLDLGTSGQGGVLFGRQAFVGLTGSAGTLTLGRQYTTAAWVQAETDPFGTGLSGTSANLISPGGIGGITRMDNAVKYQSPMMSGLQAALMYSPGEVANSKANQQLSGSVGYTQGPLLLRASYHELRDVNEKRGKLTYLGGSYDFGMLTGYANYVINKGNATVGVIQDDAIDIMLGVTVPVGPGKFIASYINKDDKTSANRDASQLAVGYVYPLSKRTNLYTSYARIRNKNGASYTVGNSTDGGTGDRAFNFGMRHSF